jgi:CheY-like chemotaxis protein
VSDTGCGIEAKVLANIFEPFYTTKDQSKGTGLGLSTVFGILKQCGGFINVYSEVGRGTTFRIYFPAVSEAQAEVAPEVAAQHQATGGRILIVEDDVVLLGVIPQMLEQLGYSVRVARSGDEVLQMDWEAEGPFDLLLTDVIMPGMNGQELSNHLRALHPELKVLFMSGYTANIITQTGVLGEGNHFIAKPFILADLGRKLASLIGG